MRTTHRNILLFVLAAAVCAAAQFAGRADFILTLKNGCHSDRTFIELRDEYNLTPKFSRHIHGCMPVRIPGDMSRSTIRRLLETDRRIARVEPDYRVGIVGSPNDPDFAKQWSLHNRILPGVDIRAIEAWGLHRGSRRIILAIIDSGIDYNHPDRKSVV